MASAGNVFSLSKMQAPIQAFLKPGLWIPGIRTPHLYKEVWTLHETALDVFEEIIKSIESVQDRGGEKFEVTQRDEEGLFIQTVSFTRYCNWLDVMEIQLDTALTQSGK